MFNTLLCIDGFFPRQGINDSAPQINPDIFENEAARQCLTAMGVTSENVAQRFGISRAEQDQMAVESHQKAAAAQKNGWFDEELGLIYSYLIE